MLRRYARSLTRNDIDAEDLVHDAQSMSASAAQALFWAFCAIMGLSLASIFLVFTGTSIARTFFIAAAMFGATSLYGYTTRRDIHQTRRSCPGRKLTNCGWPWPKFRTHHEAQRLTIVVAHRHDSPVKQVRLRLPLPRKIQKQLEDVDLTPGRRLLRTRANNPVAREKGSNAKPSHNVACSINGKPRNVIKQTSQNLP
jgi:hypothetical protein